MPSIADTTYPRFDPRALGPGRNDFFTPTVEEIDFAKEHSPRTDSPVACLLLLKSFQRLGYFPALTQVPEFIVSQLAEGIAQPVPSPKALSRHDRSGSRQRQRLAVLKLLGVRSFSRDADTLIRTVMERDDDF